MPEPVLIAVAHGSADPQAAATVADLMATVSARARARGLSVPDLRTAYLGHAAPSLAQVMQTVEGRVTVLPLLLTAAYHSKADIPRVLARCGPHRVSYGATLGPHPLLLRALERRLAEAAGPDAGDTDPGRTGVVLAAAGSSDPEANATIARLAARWQAEGGWFAVRPAYASAATPSPAAAVTALLQAGASRVLVATYLLAPGFFADRVRASSLAAGAAAVAAPLGAADEVADVLLDRYQEARSLRRTAA
jgi:sirohydrochlorin ferrochelatase